MLNEVDNPVTLNYDEAQVVFQTPSHIAKYGVDGISATPTGSTPSDNIFSLTFDQPPSQLMAGDMTLEFQFWRDVAPALSDTLSAEVMFLNTNLNYCGFSYAPGSGATQDWHVTVGSRLLGTSSVATVNIPTCAGGQWHAMALCITGSAQAKLFIDGALIATLTLATATPTGVQVSGLRFVWGDTSMAMAELRLTLAALYPTDYTPQDAPFRLTSNRVACTDVLA